MECINNTEKTFPALWGKKKDNYKTQWVNQNYCLALVIGSNVIFKLLSDRFHEIIFLIGRKKTWILEKESYFSVFDLRLIIWQFLFEGETFYFSAFYSLMHETQVVSNKCLTRIFSYGQNRWSEFSTLIMGVNLRWKINSLACMSLPPPPNTPTPTYTHEALKIQPLTKQSFSSGALILVGRFNY